MSTWANVRFGRGRKVHRAYAPLKRKDYFVTYCGMSGFVGSKLTLAVGREPSCAICLRKIEVRP